MTPLHLFREQFMATHFELRIAHADESYARHAAQAAFALTDRLEQLLSRYREESEISRIRNLREGENLRLNPDTFDCLRLALDLHQLTRGAFDPTLGARMDRLRSGATHQEPDLGPGPGRLILQPENFTVRCEKAPVDLDLGAIGKGYALDRMADVLREWEIDSALLTAGDSSILALGKNPSGANWEVQLSRNSQFLLADHASISASGTTVKGRHILDPRTGAPAPSPFRAWALAHSAAISDALSTAWMILSQVEIGQICRERRGIAALIQIRESIQSDFVRIGMD
jgi:thiamine biosynthesis lipoprotein